MNPFFFKAEMAKQMKVKKLKNLKTLDSKPGETDIQKRLHETRSEQRTWAIIPLLSRHRCV